MKPISELGLELIEIEDHFLLVQSDWKDIPYIKNAKDDKVYMIAKEKIALEILSVPVKNCPQIIASTKQLEGLPLLVIEDEVEYMADNCVKNHPANRTLNEDGWMSTGYVYGYNKAKETYKFTEEDLKIALSEAFKASQEGYQITSDEIIQSLTKKELWIEIENYCGSPYTTERCPKCVDSCDSAYQRPKIKDGKIKAIWK